MKNKLKKALEMLKYFGVLTAMIASIVVGLYGIVYAMIYAFVYIVIFLVSLAGLGFGLFTLNIVTKNLR